jgi:Asp-tRNA(Asn)/Glu-tRNA(Gln) amidotransferase A subunit family amidase
MVPLAIGTQTNGSVIRPASFCGVVGFKPSFGLIPRTGILPQASSLDTVGVFARTVEDAALLADALAGDDPSDPDTRVAAAPRLLETARSEPPVRPTLAFVNGTAWEKAAPETQEGFAELVAALGDACRELKLHESYATVYPAAATLARVGHARHYGAYFDRGADQLSPFMREMITEGRRVTALDYLAARDLQGALYKGLEEMFDHYDAILTPAAPGEAPPADSTGDPSFNTLWTFCGVPAISLPLLQGPNGLPVGVQVVGRRGEDARLLRTARWLYGTLTSGT